MTTNLLQNPSEINSIIKYPKYTSHASQITPQTEPLFPFLKSTLLPRKKLNVLNDNSAILPIVTPNDLINFPYNINQSGVRNNSVELLKNTTISKKDIDISHYTQDELLQVYHILIN